MNKPPEVVERADGRWLLAYTLIAELVAEDPDTTSEDAVGGIEELREEGTLNATFIDGWKYVQLNEDSERLPEYLAAIRGER